MRDILLEIAIFLWVLSVLDTLIFAKRRAKKYKKQIADGIIAELEKADKVIYITKDNLPMKTGKDLEV